MTKRSSCPHPDRMTLTTLKSCGCKHLKCMACSMEAVLKGCTNHGARKRILNPGRK